MQLVVRHAALAGLALLGLTGCFFGPKAGPDAGAPDAGQPFIEITPASPQVAEGATLQLVAEEKRPGGDVVVGISFLWSSSDNSVATVDSTGKVTGVHAGTATISAGGGGLIGTTQLTVTASQGGNFKLTVLGGGNDGKAPLSNVRVLLQDPDTGAYQRDLVTNSEGVVDFGAVPKARVTATLVPGQGQFISLVKIPTTTAFFAPFDNGGGGNGVGSVNVTVTNIPSGNVGVQLATGDNGQYQTPNGGATTQTFNSVQIGSLQPDGKFSLLAAAFTQNNGTSELAACGSAADQAATALGGNLTIPLSAPSGTITFSASSPVDEIQQRTYHQGQEFDLSGVHRPATAESAGSFSYCSLPGSERTAYEADVWESSNAPARRVALSSATPPSSLSFGLPAISIDNLSRSSDGNTLSWTASGADLGQFAVSVAELRWRQGSSGRSSWTVLADAATQAMVLPQLAPDLVTQGPPATNVGVRFQLAGWDTVAGLDDLIQKGNAASGNFNAVIGAASVSREARRNIPVVAVRLQGSGTVTSSPPGINCGSTCTATFAPGTRVTLTASGGTFQGWQNGPCGGNQTTCTLEPHDLDGYTEIGASFQ